LRSRFNRIRKVALTEKLGSKSAVALLILAFGSLAAGCARSAGAQPEERIARIEKESHRFAWDSRRNNSISFSL